MSELSKNFPIIDKMTKGEEVFFINTNKNDILSDEITKAHIKEASERLTRFAPYIRRVFDNTDNGIIESPLKEIVKMQAGLSGGRLLLKCDNLLPISGSIKARGGIYEVLYFAEQLAVNAGMLNINDDYSVLTDERFKTLFSEYEVAVGSTGNLGLSIGIIGRAFGFNVTVHMSSDAKKWKKDKLREIGANVVEYKGDYEKAVAEGRKLAETDSRCHFVDDENSKTLFMGYAVAAERLAAQLAELRITVNESNPLLVYLPCGVGGGPGGVAYGLKQIFGSNVHCFFAEPVQAPCMLLGVMTGLDDGISALDIGLSGKTDADGLAVTRPSRLVSRIVGNLLDGIFTVSDERLHKLVSELYRFEDIFVEPSAAAGFLGYSHMCKNEDYVRDCGIKGIENAVHIVWATGGSMVPIEEQRKYYSI